MSLCACAIDKDSFLFLLFTLAGIVVNPIKWCEILGSSPLTVMYLLLVVVSLLVSILLFMFVQRERRVPVNPHHAKLSKYLHQKSICCCWCTTTSPSSVRHDESHKGCALCCHPEFGLVVGVQKKTTTTTTWKSDTHNALPGRETDSCEISCCAFILRHCPGTLRCTVCGSQWTSTRKCEVVFRWAVSYSMAGCFSSSRRLGKSNRISAIHK